MDIRGSGPNHGSELLALTLPRVFPIPGSTGLHHAIITLPKFEELVSIVCRLSPVLAQAAGAGAR